MGAKAKAKTKTATKTKPKAKTKTKTKAKAAPAKAQPKKKAAKKAAPKKRAPRAEPEPWFEPEPELETETPPLDLIAADGEEDSGGGAAEPAKKPGPFARLGSLFARMTGKKAEPPPSEPTVEIVTGDIVMEQPAPPPVPEAKSKKRKAGG